jgi:hypothetical protein
LFFLQYEKRSCSTCTKTKCLFEERMLYCMWLFMLLIIFIVLLLFILVIRCISFLLCMGKDVCVVCVVIDESFAVSGNRSVLKQFSEMQVREWDWGCPAGQAVTGKITTNCTYTQHIKCFTKNAKDRMSCMCYARMKNGGKGFSSLSPCRCRLRCYHQNLNKT